MTRLSPLLLVPFLAALGACAQEVGDIDRTSPDGVRKADLLDGEWYVRQTVSDVPATSGTSFIGQTYDTDKVRFAIEEGVLVAHRSYEFAPGASDRAATDDGDVIDSGAVDDRRLAQEGAYYGAPILAYAIDDHFDVQRQYNAATGEESNVIVENSSDRDWFDTEYMRVDWAAIMISGWGFLDSSFGLASATSGITPGGVFQFVGDGEDGEDRVRWEYDEDGNLVYFDFVTRAYMNPDLSGCLTMLQVSGAGDCAAQQIEIRTSFRRAPTLAADDYEPLPYDDRAMNRFGYFRTERVAYDRERGATVDGRILLANRHDIWVDSFARDADGNAVRDEDGRRVALPFSERVPAPIVYHLSPNFPDALLPYAADTAAGWDRAYRRAVAAAQNDGDISGADDVRPMYVLCANPVSDTPVYPADPAYAADCGEVGDEVFVGDLRYNVMYWVTNPQMSGPLGYGPSAPDPETGEIVSGTAYVYGAAVDTYAQSSLDIIRFANGDLVPEDLTDPEYIRDELLAARDIAFDPRAGASFAAIGQVEIPADPAQFVTGLARERIDAVRRDASDGNLDELRTGPGWEERRIRIIEESGLDLLGMNDELLLAAPTAFDSHGHALPPINPTSAQDDDTIERARVTHWMREMSRGHRAEREFQVGHNCVLSPSTLDDSILGIAERYYGRTDYEEIYTEIRGLIFKAVMEHEVGHTLGLRHNFGASWDALNYFDEYWDAKLEGYPSVDASGAEVVRPFGAPESVADLYGIARQTPAQITARMREFQYSSIMDYSSAFNTDFGGVGRYDDAAIMFAYTGGAGRTAALPDSDDAHNTIEMGYVEVWPNLPAAARNTLIEYEDRRGIGFYHPLEEYHYATLVSRMGDSPAQMGEALRDRAYVALPDLEAAIDAQAPDRPVEVPYIFCSDEFRGSRQNCRTWDRGADPLEQTLDYIQRYRRYYYFDNYRRERLGWTTSSSASRAASRLFLPLVETYQRWLLTVATSGSRPDASLDNQWTFAAYAGLNLLAEVVMTPSSGYYYLDEDDDVFRLITSQTDLSQFDPETALEISRASEFRLAEGVGRPKWSDYEADDGYYYFQYPRSSGHYLTSVLAMNALTSADVTAIGVDLGQFETSYLIPPYLVFEDELTQLFNGVFLQDARLTGMQANPTSTGYAFRHRPMVTLGLGSDQIDPETGAVVPDGLELLAGPLDASFGNPVDTRPSFSEQIYSLLWGMSGFTSNYSSRYVEQGRIYQITAGNQPVAADGFEVIQFCDPNPAGAGLCYGATVPDDGAYDGIAATLIRRGQQYQADYEAAMAADRTGDANTALNAISNLLTDVNILASVVDVYEHVF